MKTLMTTGILVMALAVSNGAMARSHGSEGPKDKDISYTREALQKMNSQTAPVPARMATNQYGNNIERGGDNRP